MVFLTTLTRCWIPACVLTGADSESLYHGCQIRLTCNLWQTICQDARLRPHVPVYYVRTSLCLRPRDRQRRQVVKEDNASGLESLNSGRRRQTKRWCDRWKEVTEKQRPASEAVLCRHLPPRCLKNCKLSRWRSPEDEIRVFYVIKHSSVLIFLATGLKKKEEVWWSLMMSFCWWCSSVCFTEPWHPLLHHDGLKHLWVFDRKQSSDLFKHLEPYERNAEPDSLPSCFVFGLRCNPHQWSKMRWLQKAGSVLEKNSD